MNKVSSFYITAHNHIIIGNIILWFFRNLGRALDVREVNEPEAFESNLHSGFSLPASNPFLGYRGCSQSQHPLCGGQGNTPQVVIPLQSYTDGSGAYRLHSHLWTWRSALDSLEDCLHLFKDTTLAANTSWQDFQKACVHRLTITKPSQVILQLPPLLLIVKTLWLQ